MSATLTIKKSGSQVLSDVATDDLISRLKALTENFAREAVKFMIDGAAIVKELESRGIDTREIDAPFIPRLLEIASGRLLPELAADDGLYGVAKGLPISDQRKIIAGEKLRVIDLETLDVDNCRMVDVSTMTKVERKILFSPTGIRSPQEQLVAARNERQRNALVATQPASDWVVDRKHKQVVIGNLRFTRTQLLQMAQAIPE